MGKVVAYRNYTGAFLNLKKGVLGEGEGEGEMKKSLYDTIYKPDVDYILRASGIFGNIQLLLSVWIVITLLITKVNSSQ